MVEARTAIAEEFASQNLPLAPTDVILTSGCSHALQLCLEVLLEPGKNVLIPNPGFPLYRTICGTTRLLEVVLSVCSYLFR